jgi:hypothetical protein
MIETDPPKTLTEAAEKFKKFLSAQHWPTTIGWVTNDNMLVDRQGRFWVRERGTEAFDQASLQYCEGVERNLGVAISAVCATDVETFASVFVAADDLDRQYHLMGRVLKLSVPTSRKLALTVRNPLEWWILELRNKRRRKALEL